jgi:hypothetical protein
MCTSLAFLIADITLCRIIGILAVAVQLARLDVALLEWYAQNAITKKISMTNLASGSWTYESTGAGMALTSTTAIERNTERWMESRIAAVLERRDECGLKRISVLDQWDWVHLPTGVKDVR